MGAADLGERLGIAPQSVLTLEKSEKAGQAGMDSLKKVSHSMKLEGQAADLSDSHHADLFQESQDSSKIWRSFLLKK